MQLSRLERVDLRTVWHTENQFNDWLVGNLDLLGEAVGQPLALVRREAPAGPFSADILAESENGSVVIESQLSPTDHDHLGKLITYFSNLNGKTAIWITQDPRPEHIAAVSWVNEFTPKDVAFFLLRVAAVRIGESPAAPQLTVVAGPSEGSKLIGETKGELAERHVLRMQFWDELLARARTRCALHAGVSGGKENWVAAGAGVAGLTYNYVVRMTDAQVELYIDRGDANTNKAVFAHFLAGRQAIEEAFGAPLEWQRLDDKRASRIRYVISSSGLSNRDNWPRLQEAMVDAMVRLETALRPALQRLRVGSLRESDD